MEVLVPVPSVRVGLFPKRPVVVPKDGALVVVVPNPAVLLPNKLCCRSQSHRIRKGSVKLKLRTKELRVLREDDASQ